VSTATAAVSTATAAVEAAATTTAVEATTAANASAMVAAACAAAVVATGAAADECVAATGIPGRPAVKAASTSGVSNSAAIAAVISSAAVVSTATVVAAATVVATASPVAVIPGASTDKEAADEPARSIVSIRRASVRIVVVVAPRTDRSRVSIPIIPVSSVTNPDAHTYLSVSRSRHERCGNYQRAEQQKISEKLHFGPPRQGIMHCVTNRFGDSSNTLGYLRVPTT
jgi:hypothetical protein